MHAQRSGNLRPMSRPEPFQAPRGTHDILPPDSARWEALVAVFAGHARRAGYGFLQSPMFEELDVFRRMGEGTDVVRKEMYDFFDKSDPPRHLALRPEGTASVVRAYLQHHPVPPWKVWYAAPSFRYEAVQAGRLRQHHQLGVEALGPDDADLDVEVIALLWDFYRSLGLERLDLVVNSMGSLEDRAAYIERLRAYLNDHADALDPDDRLKIADHPLRVLDSKRPASQEVADAAPTLMDGLSPEAVARFERVRDGLSALGIAHEVDQRLVRGLDYYTHTTFEVKALALDAAQNTIGGGGRYDGLAEALNGKPTPGIGFGTGIERTLLACDAESVFDPPDVAPAAFVVDVTGGEAARDLTFELRRAGLAADRAWGARSMKAQMKSANRSGAAFALIVGESELADGVVMIRPLRDDRDQRQVPRAEVAAAVQALRSEAGTPDTTMPTNRTADDE
jgi:histidyl-tRNA synthetase